MLGIQKLRLANQLFSARVHTCYTQSTAAYNTVQIGCLVDNRLAMRWPSLWTPYPSQQHEDHKNPGANASQTPGEALDSFLSTSKSASTPAPFRKSADWSSLITTTPLQLFFARENILPTAVLTGTCLAFYAFYRSYLRRIPVAGNISPGFFRKRSLVGRVTSVGDGDNFRVFHTPGGRLAGWGWLPWRRVPNEKKELKNKTVSCGNVEPGRRYGGTDDSGRYIFDLLESMRQSLRTSADHRSRSRKKR